MHTHTLQPESGFANTGLSKLVLSTITAAGFSIPTPIQEKAIPEAVAGHDLIGLAETGTGKTMAFALPIIDRLLANPQDQALILVPTRELALQVEESFRKLTRLINGAPRTVSLIGGAPIYRQKQELRNRPRIIVATPGRLRDHLEQRSVNLDAVKILVLDEADRMLDMGFAPQIKFVCSLVPTDRQTFLFSATFPAEIAQFANQFLKDPVRIDVAVAGSSAKLIKQELCYVSRDEKLNLLRKLLDEQPGTVLVFSRTKHGATKLKQQLTDFTINAAEIHSNRSLGQRKEALLGFKTGKYRVLVATDVAARGIDVQDIQLVINFDLPDASEDYVHRIGRTGRAGKTGHAISFATPDQRRDVQSIERLIGQNLPLSKWSQAAPSYGGGYSSGGYRSGAGRRPQSGGGRPGYSDRSRRPAFGSQSDRYDRSSRPAGRSQHVHRSGSGFSSNSGSDSSRRINSDSQFSSFRRG